MGFRVEGSLAESVKKFGRVCRVCDWGLGLWDCRVYHLRFRFLGSLGMRMKALIGG